MNVVVRVTLKGLICQINWASHKVFCKNVIVEGIIQRSEVLGNTTHIPTTLEEQHIMYTVSEFEDSCDDSE